MDYTTEEMDFEEWFEDESGFSDDKESAEKEFDQNLSNYYLSILQEEYDYIHSEEAIIETIEANEIMFNEKGERFTL